MSSPSNLYAEKVFSEHPLALWSLDDKADYISLISEQQRMMSEWISSSANAEEVDITGEPHPNSLVSKVSFIDTSSPVISAEMVSEDLITFSNLNQELGTFSIGAFIYPNTEIISGFYLGYEYYDFVSGENIQKLKYFSNQISNNWIFVSETFNILNQNSSIRLVIKAEAIGNVDEVDYSFLVNGVSFGQWSEEFNSTSLGTIKEEISSSILGQSGIFGIKANAYGLSETFGYYLSSSNALVAKNTGLPLVYGASNATTLYPNNGLPSLIIPGFGFLNESGKFKEYTFESWIRIGSDSTEYRRIFGNLKGSDGLYVSGAFLHLIINDKIISHYVGKWYRPMLVSIRYSSGSISLLINGELVGEVFVDFSELAFPELVINSDSQTIDGDWLAFWAHDDVSPIEIDAAAIYGYKVSPQVAKRRFIYGQGVEFPENINNAYSGSSVFIDYPFANYSANYSYPAIGRWAQGSYDNASFSDNALSIPKNTVPQIFLDGRTNVEWLSAIESSQIPGENFITLVPNEDWAGTSGYILLDELSLENEIPKGIYLICQESEPTVSSQTILSLRDNITQESFDIKLTPNSIDYVISSGSEEFLVASKQRLFLGESFPVGVNFQRFSDYYGGKAAQFFGKLSELSVFIAGKRDFSSTFTGKIFNIGVCSLRNLNEIGELFYVDGTMFSEIFLDGNNLDLILDAGENLSTSAVFSYVYDGGTLGSYAENKLNFHRPSYGIFVGNSLSGFKLLASSRSIWEDYIPLSYFAKNVKDSRGDERLDLDFIQINIDHPAPSIFVASPVSGSWTYEELRSEYSNPIQRQYTSLDNYLFTGFQDYDDLKNRSTNSYSYDTSMSSVRGYITFQLMENGGNLPLEAYVNIELAPKDGIINPGSEWINTAYEFVDGMIVYPPQSVDFSKIAIVTHIVIDVPNTEDFPVQLKSLEYSSLSLSDTEPTPVGTRFGNSIYPYRKDGFYFSYKEKNPFSIYKGSTPYLYLTRDSGITLRGSYDPTVNRGISIPINQSSADDYKVIALQTAVRFDQDFFPYAPMQIFELESKNSYIRFYLVATHPSGKRAKIYAINSRGEVENGIAFFLNGKLVKEPTITVKEWAMIGVRFANTLDFSGYVGGFRLTAPLTINNFSHYKSTNLQEVQTVLERSWFKVFSSGLLTIDWQFWNTIPYLWNEVLVLATTSYYGVDPGDIYRIYTGTNKIIVDDGVETKFGDYSYKAYKDVSWQSQIIQAV